MKTLMQRVHKPEEYYIYVTHKTSSLSMATSYN